MSVHKPYGPTTCYHNLYLFNFTFIIFTNFRSVTIHHKTLSNLSTFPSIFLRSPISSSSMLISTLVLWFLPIHLSFYFYQSIDSVLTKHYNSSTFPSICLLPLSYLFIDHVDPTLLLKFLSIQSHSSALIFTKVSIQSSQNTIL